jgi:hypothetical protein
MTVGYMPQESGALNHSQLRDKIVVQRSDRSLYYICNIFADEAALRITVNECRALYCRGMVHLDAGNSKVPLFFNINT